MTCSEPVITCAWCVVFEHSTVGMCTCKEWCGRYSCPQYDPEPYTPPPVPKFK